MEFATGFNAAEGFSLRSADISPKTAGVLAASRRASRSKSLARISSGMSFDNGGAIEGKGAAVQVFGASKVRFLVSGAGATSDHGMAGVEKSGSAEVFSFLKGSGQLVRFWTSSSVMRRQARLSG